MTLNSNKNLNFPTFSDLVIQYVAPLLRELKFDVTEVFCDEVRFVSPCMNAKILCERYSHEIHFLYLRMGDDRAFDQTDLLDYKLGVGRHLVVAFQAANSEDIYVCVKKIAELIQSYGMDVLSCDQIEYQKMKSFIQARDEDFTNSVIDKPIRVAAEDAWKRQDFQQVVKLYAGMKSGLTRTENQRYAYAKSKVV